MSENDTPIPEARTFTQEEVNAIVAADRRKDKDAIVSLEAKVADLQPKVQELDRIKAEQMTEHEKQAAEIERLGKAASEAEARVKASERSAVAQAAALKVAKELGVAPDAALRWAPKLDGEDAETMEASAKDLFAAFAKSTPNPPGPADDMNESSDEDGIVAALRS